MDYKTDTEFKRLKDSKKITSGRKKDWISVSSVACWFIILKD